MIGMLGYYAGPHLYIMDPLALSDPLLARLPPVPDPYWRSGHLARAFPSGYGETVRTGKNLLRDPKLAEYYDHLALITRGKLWDPRKLTAVWNMNLGRYENLLEPSRRKIRAMPPITFATVPNPDVAIGDFSRRIRVDPKNVYAYKVRSEFFARRGNLAEAIEDLSRVIELEPDNASAYSERGGLFVRCGEVRKAMGDFNRAIDIDPREAAPYLSRGTIYAEQGNDEMALEDFNRAVELDPGEPMAYLRRGMSYAKLRMWQGAWGDFQEAISRAPWNPVGYHLLACTPALALADREDLKALNSELLKPPTDVSTEMGNLAWALATCPEARYRNGTDALRYAKQSLAMASQDTPMIRDTLAAAYAEVGRFAEATVAAQQAIQLALAQGKQTLAKSMQVRLQLYQAHQAYHASPGSK